MQWYLPRTDDGTYLAIEHNEAAVGIIVEMYSTAQEESRKNGKCGGIYSIYN